MNQAELVSVIAHEAASPKSEVERVLKVLGTVTQEALKEGDEVTLPGIGKLRVSQRAARTGRNPQTGAAIEIAAKKAPKFTALKVLKDALN